MKLMLTLVERWFGELTNTKLTRGAHRSVRQLNKDISAWIETWNEPRAACSDSPEAFAGGGEPWLLRNQRLRARPMACDATGNAIGTGLTHIRR